MIKYILSLVTGAVLLATIFTTSAYASGFNASRIIDDGVFTDATSMNTTQIQQFLNSKVPSCDTWGSQPSEYGGGTRRQWAEARGYSAPFTCLKDYNENGKPAAQIISEVSQHHGINPKVMLVLLQKEQSLVTDTWPLSTQYRTATGYGCPDTAPCASQYYGFTNQLNKAAFMFRSIMNASPSWYTPYVLGNNFIRYSPTSSCGGSTVNITNRATQALYNYTPYQPNAAALAAGWGTAPCGSYGNRNFYLYFTNWFGSTTAAASFGYSIVSREIYSDSNYQTRIADSPTVEPNSDFYVKVTIKNTGNQVWSQDSLRLGTEGPKDRVSIFANDWLSPGRPAAMTETSVTGGNDATFKFKMRTPTDLGAYSETFGVLIEGNRWLNGTFTLPITVASANPYYAFKTTLFDTYADSALTRKTTPQNLTLYTGSRAYAKLMIKNTGNQTFPGSLTKLATSNPLERASIYKGDDWISTGRVVLPQEGDIAPGATGTFKFSITAPNTPQARQQERFGLVIEGQRWLSEYIGSLSVQTVQRPPQILTPNQSLEKNNSLASSDERYKLVLQGDGNLVLYSPNRVLWASWTVGKGAERLIMQSDGNLVLYRADWTPVWHSNTGGKGLSNLLLQSDGNLVTYPQTGSPSWHTNTGGQQ